MTRRAGAIDIGGTRTKLGVVAADGRILAKEAIPTPERGEPEPLVAAIAETLAPMIERAAADGDVAETVGVSVAGFLDPRRTMMQSNANLPRLCDYPLKAALENRLDRPTILEVDSNASTIAELRHGAGVGAARLLGVIVGTGIGGGVILNGRVLRYTGECAGDLGHVIVARNGKRCSCGARGCLEAMANAAALSQRGGGRPVRAIIDAARRGDESALAAIRETAHWLGIGLASLSALFAPDTIVVGGGVAAAGDALLDPVRESYRENAGDDFRERTRILGSTFDGWEGLIGAATIVLDPTDGKAFAAAAVTDE